MMDSAIYRGRVTHKRLRPKPHALSYGVFSLLLDLDDLPQMDRRLRLFSWNRSNLLSFHDRDHGPGEPHGLAAHIRGVLAAADLDPGPDGRVMILCYPRVLGYVFNPLSVYYAYTSAGALHALIYEVNNTWGERHSYVVAAGADRDGIHAQAAAKRMHVSPFASPEGRYGFQVSMRGADLTVGVRLSDSQGPLIKTYFNGRAYPLSDACIARTVLRYPLMTFKVIAAIHWEALKIWWKGVPLARGESQRRYTISGSPFQSDKVTTDAA